MTSIVDPHRRAGGAQWPDRRVPDRRVL